MGPCWICGEVGHLKTSCLRLSKSYLFILVGNSHSGVNNKVLAIASQGGKVKAGPCYGAVVVTKLKPAKGIQKETCQSIGEVGMAPGFKVTSGPESLEWETCLSMDKVTSLRQCVNDQSELFDTVTLARGY